MKILLITGIPGTGKTTIGNYLAEKYHYAHFDFETISEWPINFQQSIGVSIEAFVEEVKKINKNIIITWGFMPGTHDLHVLTLKKLGAKMFWLDGDRSVARKFFIQRKTVSVECLDIQMQRINSTDIIGIFNPIAINPFDEEGNFLEKEEIAKKLMQKII